MSIREHALQDEIEQYKYLINSLRTELNNKSNEIVELQTELHELRPIADQVDSLRAELAVANGRCFDLNSACESYMEDNQKLEDELFILRDAAHQDAGTIVQLLKLLREALHRVHASTELAKRIRAALFSQRNRLNEF